LTVIAGSRDDIGVAVYRRGQDEEAIQATLALMSGPARREFDEVPTMTAGTFREDVAWELARLQTVGIDQVAIVDLSRPDLGIPVVRVVIPGLEGIYEATGFSPGPRLRERLS
jgi:ribosomal protein S12 methylthiotransferase accessory factor